MQLQIFVVLLGLNSCLWLFQKLCSASCVCEYQGKRKQVSCVSVSPDFEIGDTGRNIPIQFRDRHKVGFFSRAGKMLSEKYCSTLTISHSASDRFSRYSEVCLLSPKFLKGSLFYSMLYICMSRPDMDRIITRPGNIG